MWQPPYKGAMAWSNHKVVWTGIKLVAFLIQVVSVVILFTDLLPQDSNSVQVAKRLLSAVFAPVFFWVGRVLKRWAVKELKIGPYDDADY